MKLYYFKSTEPNFGDELNQWMWDELLPGVFDQDASTWVSVIGTIIEDGMPPADHRIVFASGTGYSPPPADFGKDGWTILCVRGPLTAKVLGLPDHMAVTDGAALLSLLPRYSPLPEDQRQGIVFMPHHKALRDGNWAEACARAGITYLDPRDDSKTTIEKIRHAKLVLADAMHAAIVADTLRVPWVPIVASPEINGFKWLDWSLSVGQPYHPVTLPSSALLEWATRFAFNVFGGFHARGESFEKAISDYHHKLKLQKSWRRFLEKKARLGLSKTLRKTIQVLKKTKLGQTWDQHCATIAAQALRQAAEGRSYLSADTVFFAKRDDLYKRLQQLKDMKDRYTA